MNKKFISRVGSLLFTLCFIFSTTTHAQLTEVYEQKFSQSFILSTPTPFIVPNFPSPAIMPTQYFPLGQGTATLLAFRFSVNGQISFTAGLENISNFPMIPTRSWEVDFNRITHWGGITTSCPGFTSVHASQIGATTPLGPYDGITNYSGTSGYTENLNLSFNSNQTVLATPSKIQCASSSFWTAFPNGFTPLPNVEYDFTGTHGFFLTSEVFTHSFVMEFSYIYSIPNSNAPDCDNDGIANSYEIIINNKPDLDHDGIPDYCDSLPDCDSNGTPDWEEIYNGASDCDANDIPDSCEITATPSLDTGPEFGLDGTLDQCQGRVQWDSASSSALGIIGAVTNAYWISGTDLAPVFNPIPNDPLGASSSTDSTGKFIVPREYFSYPTQSGEIARGIRASVSYSDDTGLASPVTRTITNYPGWDPLKPLRSHTFDRKIYFPAPVVFQGGVMARINGSSVTKLREFMTLDAASTGSNPQWDDVKRGSVFAGPLYARLPIPSFIFFALPSAPQVTSTWVPTDGVSWGYNNNPRTINAAVTSGNASTLQNFIMQRVKPRLDTLTQGTNSSSVPLNIIAHSYGGLVTRRWITDNHSYPKLNRYVSFDAVHGGTNHFSTYFNPWFSEKSLNGASSTINSAPVNRGWNYSHVLPSSSSFLFFSDTPLTPAALDPIAPYTSAFGIGRTINPTSYKDETNGHCARFIGGWELPVFEGNHSLQDESPEIVSASRFLAYGLKPYVGSQGNPGDYTTSADYSKDPLDPVYSSVGCNAAPTVNDTPNGTATLQITVPTSGQTDFSFQMDTIALVHFEAQLSSTTATLRLFNNSGVELTRLNETITPNESGALVSFDFDNPGTAAKKLRLDSTIPATAVVTITFPNNRFLVGETDFESYNSGSNVLVRARMRGASGGVINPNSGTINSVIKNPNGIETALELFDDGLHGDGAANNGTYANTFNATTTPGFYNVHTVANYVWAGWPIFRSDDHSFEVLSSAATLSPTMTQRTILSPQTGQTQGLAIDFTVNTNTTGNYRLVGELVGPNGTISVLDKAFAITSVGQSTQSLEIPLLTLINAAGMSPVTLQNARLVEPVQGQILGENPPLTLTLPVSSSLSSPPLPIIGQLLPNFGPIKTPSSQPTIVTIYGSNLGTTRTVRVGKKSATFSIVSDEMITVAIPTGVKATGVTTPVDITVATLGGKVTLSNGYSYIR